MDLTLNNAVMGVELSGIRQFTYLVRDTPGACALTIGEPDLNTPDVIKEAAKAALDANDTHYPPGNGYPYALEAISKFEAEAHGLHYAPSEIILTVGATEALFASFSTILNPGDEVIIPTPAFGLYEALVQLQGGVPVSLPTEHNHFQIVPEELKAAITDRTKAIILTSPNNPTGATYSVEQLKAWVAWAKANDAVILFDAAYECFVSEPGLARSIFEVEGAKEVAIEVCSFSKIAGFTGTRCGYTVVPKELEREGMNINKLWLRRQTTKFNGVPYVVQRAAAAVFTESGMAEIQQNLDYYRKNAKVIADALDECGVWYCGGKNSPYIWLRCPNEMGSWEFFDWLLDHAHVVGTPGEGFGPCGKGYFRLTAFGDAERTKEAAARIKAALATL